jgi:hypothetical protein
MRFAFKLESQRCILSDQTRNTQRITLQQGQTVPAQFRINFGE